MANPQLTEENSSAGIGAAAAYAGAERRRALLSDAKAAWLVAFDEFKRQESLAAEAGSGASAR